VDTEGPSGLICMSFSILTGVTPRCTMASGPDVIEVGESSTVLRESMQYTEDANLSMTSSDVDEALQGLKRMVLIIRRRWR